MPGYAQSFDAKVRCARLARDLGRPRPALADRLEQDAVALKLCFNRDYWLLERQCSRWPLTARGHVDAFGRGRVDLTRTANQVPAPAAAPVAAAELQPR